MPHFLVAGLRDFRLDVRLGSPVRSLRSTRSRNTGPIPKPQTSFQKQMRQKRIRCDSKNARVFSETNLRPHEQIRFLLECFVAYLADFIFFFPPYPIPEMIFFFFCNSLKKFTDDFILSFQFPKFSISYFYIIFFMIYQIVLTYPYQ